VFSRWYLVVRCGASVSVAVPTTVKQPLVNFCGKTPQFGLQAAIRLRRAESSLIAYQGAEGKGNLESRI